MNRCTGRFFPRPTEAAVDVDETVDVTVAEPNFTQSRPHTANISRTLSSSASEDDVYNPELKSVADAWIKVSNGIRRAVCWAFFMAQEGAGGCDADNVPLHC